MMIRFIAGQVQPDIWERTLAVIRANRDCFDEVWFCTKSGFPTLEEHRKHSAVLAAAAADVRRIGVIPSLQIGWSIGHGDAMAAFAGAAGKTWGGYVGRNGEQCRFVNCPRQPGFLKYMEALGEIYAQWHPGSVWIDDDLRLNNHAPAMDYGGCYCRDCLALFARDEGKLYTREELVSACGRDAALGARWTGFGVRSLEGIARAIAGGIRRVSPETRVGLQHNQAKTRNTVFKVLQEISGHRSASRPGGMTYSDMNPFSIINKGIECSMQKVQQPGYDVLGQVCPEIESYPRTFGSKTSRGHRLESIIYLALGMDSLSYAVMDPGYETPEWYGENIFAPLAAEAPAYKEFIRFNEGTEPGGTGLFGSTAPGCEELGFPLIGTPLAGFSPASCCAIVTAKCVERSADEELEQGLKGNLLVDAGGAAALEKRGFGRYIGNVRLIPVEEGFRVLFSKHPLCSGFENVPFPTFDGSWSSRPCRIENAGAAGFQELTHFEDRDGKKLGVESVLFTRPDGTRVFISGCSFFVTCQSSRRMTLMNRVADWVSGEKMPVLTACPARVTLIPRVAPDSTLRSVTVVNSSIAPRRDLELIFRSVPENMKTVKWLVPAEPARELPVRRRNGLVSVVIPALGPWDAGFVECR